MSNENLSYEPRVGILGKTGVGKSSLCSALSGQDVCAISDIEACTGEPKEVLLKIGEKGMKLLDVPSFGESQDKDEEYGKLYTELLPELDLVLWVLKGDDRAFSSDELFYKNIVKPHLDQEKPFLFVLNQVDKIEPFREWDESKHSPGSKQLENIQKKVHAVSEVFHCPESWIVPVSASERYNLNVLRDKIYSVGLQVKEENLSQAAQEDIQESGLDTVTVKETVGNLCEDAKEENLERSERMSKGNDLNDFFDRLGVPPEKREAIQAKLNEKLSYEPKIGIFGKTGVGKSSLCNALFGQDVCPISDVEACTRDTQEVLLKTGGTGIKLLDVPGVGENQARDEEYGKLYAKLLPELDLVLWVLKADDRAFSSDELFYKNIVKPHIDQGKPFLFVINQVDKIEPVREWDLSKHSPGSKQFENIQKKVHVVSEVFHCTESWVIPVSANERYNLNVLVDRFLFALPRDKVYTVGRQVKEENVSQVAQEYIQKSLWETVKEVVSDLWEGAKAVITFAVDIVDILKDIFDIFGKKKK